MMLPPKSLRIALTALALVACSGDQEDPDGGGALAADGGAGGSSSGGDAGNGVCGPHRLDAGRVTPDILIVLDRSASMQNTGVDRWGPSVSGIEAITRATDDTIHYGLMVFPRSDTSMVGGTYSCEPGRVEVPIGANTAGAIQTALDGISPGGATPTAASLEVARGEVLRDYDPDAQATPAYVLLVTDGAPNCSGGTFSGGQGAAALQPEEVERSIAIIADLAAKGVKTYVLGYDARSDRQLVNALNQMAQAGGTGDQEFRPVNDQDSLLAEFQRITGAALSCDYALNGPVDDPTVVSVKLDGQAVPFLQSQGAEDGWTLSGNKRVVTLRGSYCDKLLDGKKRTLEVDVTCTPQIVL
jgi:von Willebrand factor type A domain